MIKLADKGGAIVIWSSKDYEEEALTVLNLTTTSTTSLFHLTPILSLMIYLKQSPISSGLA